MIEALDVLAVVAFAVTGALVASRKQLDVLGFVWLATFTGVGGGTTRDIILGVPVFWVSDPTPIVICLGTAVVVHFIAPLIQSRYRVILWFDAFGMAFVTVAGAATALAAGAGPLVAILMGVMTASVGGIIRDTVGQEPSIILRREIYVAAAAAGAAVYVMLTPWGGAAPLGFTIALLIRLAALRFGWALPAYRPRAGRDPDDVE